MPLTSGETAITAAFIGSSSGWAGFYLAVRSNRRALSRQTDEIRQATSEQTTELKEHISTRGDGRQRPAPET